MGIALVPDQEVDRLREIARTTVRRLAGAADYVQVFVESSLAAGVETVSGENSATCLDLREGVGCLAHKDGRWRYTAVTPARVGALSEWLGVPDRGTAALWSAAPEAGGFIPLPAEAWRLDDEAAARVRTAGSVSIRSVEDFTHRRVAVSDTGGRDHAHASHTLRRRVEATVTASGRRYRGLGRWLRREEDALHAEGPVGEVVGRAVDHALAAATATFGGRHRTPVVFGPSAAAAFLHELIGHALEADNFAAGSAYVEGLRRRGAVPDALTVRDDPTVAHGYGSSPADDEGVPAAVTTLLENGEIGCPLTSVRAALRGGWRRTSNARRADFRVPAIPRATNTVVLPGSDAPERLVESSGTGVLYVGCLGAGMIRIDTGEFSFAGLDSHLLTPGGGRVPARDVSLVGDALDTLARLEGIGSDHGGDNITCGKQGQMLGIGVYSPTMRYAALDWSAG